MKQTTLLDAPFRNRRTQRFFYSFFSLRFSSQNSGFLKFDNVLLYFIYLFLVDEGRDDSKYD